MRCKVNACFESSASPLATPKTRLPVFCTNVASVIGWNATAVDNYSKDYEAYAGDDLHCAENEFDLLN